MLIRDPFDSIWSEYQRRISNSHTGSIRAHYFDWVRWGANAGQLAHRYLQMCSKHFSYIESELAPFDIFTIKYEDLQNKQIR
jgi:hypothetical protein